MRRTIGLAAALLLATACGGDDDTPVGPDGAACTRGTIAGGVVRQGTTSAADCKFFESLYFTDTLYYESYTAQLVAGRAYVFYLRDREDTNTTVSDDFDTAMGLYSATGAVAMSDDDGGGVLNGHNSQIFFVAPVSGTYSVRAHGYSQSDTGDYQLVGRSCGAGVLGFTAAALGTLTSTDCIVVEFAFGGDSTNVDFYRLTLDAGEVVDIGVTATGFTPQILIGGPGFDVLDYLDGATYDYSAPTTGTTAVLQFTAADSGDYTVMVGSSSFTARGNYALGAEIVPPPAASMAPAPVSSTGRTRVKK